MPSSPILRFTPKPKATFVRSVATGVLRSEVASVTREKLGFIIAGAGDCELLICPGAGLPFADIGREDGNAVKPVISITAVDLSLAVSFFFFAFSVLPFESVGGSRNSLACGTALLNH